MLYDGITLETEILIQSCVIQHNNCEPTFHTDDEEKIFVFQPLVNQSRGYIDRVRRELLLQ